MAKILFWKKLIDKKIQCELCPRSCILDNGTTGFCFVRKNIAGAMVLTTYGQSSGLSIDPIEKKPLNHFYPGTNVLSFGTIGCNLACQFCQNWNMSRSKDSNLSSIEAPPELIAQKAKETKCRSVAFTYNDPIIFAEYAMDVASECKRLGIKTVAVSSGYITEKAQPIFFKNINAANIDLKAFSDTFYKKFTSGYLQPVLDTLTYIRKNTNIWLEVTNLLIDGLNDSDTELHTMTEWIVKNLGKDVPLHFTAFHPTYKMLNVPVTPLKTLQNAREIALSKGIHHVYLGNVIDPIAENTYCHNCKSMLIGRKMYEITKYNLMNAHQCPHCDTKCAGIFEERTENKTLKNN